MKHFDKFHVLVSLYSALFIFAPILSGGRDILLWGFPLMPGTLLNFFSVCVITLVQDNYGPAHAKQMVTGALITKVVLWGIVMLTLLLPEAARTPGYEKVVSSGFRVVLGGVVAKYVGGIVFDIPAFQWMKQRKKGFHFAFLAALTLHNLIDRPIFLMIAKYGTGGKMWDRFLIQTMLGFVFILILTPTVTILNKLLFKKQAFIHPIEVANA